VFPLGNKLKLFLLKVDTEGYDSDVLLRGASRILQERRVRFIITS
jgi:hypothetical protein